MEYFGLTDKGRVRPTNQDIFQIEAREDNQTALLVVCDGMGGANAGNVASRFAAQSFIESAGDALSGTLDETARQNLLTQALKQANRDGFLSGGQAAGVPRHGHDPGCRAHSGRLRDRHQRGRQPRVPL